MTISTMFGEGDLEYTNETGYGDTGTYMTDMKPKLKVKKKKKRKLKVKKKK